MEKILAVQSLRVAPYEKAIDGFLTILNVHMERLIISELEGRDAVKTIYETRPDLILAIGMDALKIVKTIKNIPIIFIMAPNPHSAIAGKKNITGISMNIPQEKQLSAFLAVMPHMKTIGFLYDPVRTGHLARKAQLAAEKSGSNLIAKEVHNTKDVPPLIREMDNKIDVFWMFPDITVITPEIVNFLILFSLENNVPIVTFSEKYVELGALMSIGIDVVDIGRQAGEMAKKILSGKKLISDIKQADPRKPVISINLKIAEKFGITIDETIMKDVRIIN